LRDGASFDVSPRVALPWSQQNTWHRRLGSGFVKQAACRFALGWITAKLAFASTVLPLRDVSGSGARGRRRDFDADLSVFHSHQAFRRFDVIADIFEPSADLSPQRRIRQVWGTMTSTSSAPSRGLTSSPPASTNSRVILDRARPSEILASSHQRRPVSLRQQ